MKFNVGDWIVVESTNIPDFFTIEKITGIDEINQTYTYYCDCNKMVCNAHISWLDEARLLTEEEKVELL